MAGHADLRLASQTRARIGHRAVILPEMHPIRAKPLGEAHRNR